MDASGSSILVPKSTRFIIPASSIADGETFSYRAAVRAVEWIAGQAGVAKGSPIRTALLQGMEVPAAGAVVSLEPGPVIGVTGDSGGRSAEYGSSGDDEVGHSPIDTYEDRTAPEMLDLTAMVMTLPEELRAAISAHYPPSTRLCARVWRLDPAIGNALMARFHPQEHEAAARVAVRKETYRGWEKWRLEVRRSPERNRRFAMRSKRTPIVICHRAAPIECLE